MERVRSVLSPDLLHPKYRKEWRIHDHPTKGHCASASEALYFVMGGPKVGLTSWVVTDIDQTTHWWLQDRQGRRYDVTADQFRSVGIVPPYDRGLVGRPCGFMGQRIDVGNRYGFNRRPGKVAMQILSRAGL